MVVHLWGPHPVEGFQAYERLCELARTLGLDAQYEVIPPPGMVDLNRDNLVVICGPRLSPIIAQVLASDPNLGFAQDDQGWFLVDHATGTTYRSPRDDGEPADYAYLGRLPRIDGRGTFLYFAGIHAPGNGGAMHYLEGHLEELYGEVRTGRFSAIIGCRFDPTPARSSVASGSPRCTGQTPGRDARRYRHPGRQPGVRE